MAKSALLEQVRQTCRLKHFSLKTEKAYLTWIRRFILFNNKLCKRTKRTTAQLNQIDPGFQTER